MLLRREVSKHCLQGLIVEVISSVIASEANVRVVNYLHSQRFLMMSNEANKAASLACSSSAF